MSVLLGKGFSAGKATEENTLVNKKHSKSSINHRSSIQENPITKRIDSSKQFTPVLTQRQAFGDLSNTSRKSLQHENNKKKGKTVFSTQESTRHEIKETLTVNAFDGDLPDIEFMPPSVDQDPAPYETPSYFKGLLLGAMKTNPFKYTKEISIEEKTKTSVDRTSKESDDLPGLFYQLDIGLSDYMALDLPDIDELNL